MDKKIGIVLQARTGSTRLPKKLILPFYKDDGVFSILLKRIKKTFGNEVKIIVATTTSSNDDVIANIALSLDVSVYRGSESDVLSRFVGAAETCGVSDIIRICADNPFLDMQSLRKLIDLFSESDSDYLAYATSENIPTIKTHFGFWAEAVKLQALKKIVAITNESLYHEHVTNYIYTHKDQFSIDFIYVPEEVELHKNIRLTLDTMIDFELQKDLYAKMIDNGIDITINNIINLLDLNKELYELMEKEIRSNTK